MVASAWYRAVHALSTRILFSRVTVLHAERLPSCGPVLYLALHRNGAMDGGICLRAVPRATFLISTQLLRNPLGRLFFFGLEVVRPQDAGDRSVNHAALDGCVDFLRGAGELVIFPEGTSTLGPRHLPFKSGAARIALRALDAGVPLTVIPLGLAWERGWAFRSAAELVVGRPVDLFIPPGLGEGARLGELKRRFTAALEAVGVNVESEERQREIERLAFVTTLGTTRSYFRSLKSLERTVPDELRSRWREIERHAGFARLWTYHGVPLFPLAPLPFYVAGLAVTGLAAAVGLVVNLLPVAAGAWAGRRFPDGPNVVSLWRMLVGIPAFVIWGAAVAVAAVWFGHPYWLAVWIACTWAGLAGWHRAVKMAVAVHNALAVPALRAPALEFHRTALDLVQQAEV